VSALAPAREALARRRAALTTRQGVAVPVTAHPDDAAVIRLLIRPGTLDALDALLALAEEYGELPAGSGSRFIARADTLAAQIVAADEELAS
jgi:hypothetical protein